MQVDDLSTDMFNGRTLQRTHSASLSQTLLHIETEQAARRKQFTDGHILLSRFRPAASRDVRGQPLRQIIRIIRVDAHPRRVAVQRMPQLDRTVSLTPSQFSTRLDDQNPSLPRQA